MTDQPTTPEVTDSEVEKREKAERTASLLKLFLPNLDMILDEFDLEFMHEALNDMIQNADRYDSMAIVTPRGWNGNQHERMKREAENLKALLELIECRKKMRTNAQKRQREDITQNKFNRIFGITS